MKAEKTPKKKRNKELIKVEITPKKREKSLVFDLEPDPDEKFDEFDNSGGTPTPRSGGTTSRTSEKAKKIPCKFCGRKRMTDLCIRLQCEPLSGRLKIKILVRILKNLR